MFILLSEMVQDYFKKLFLIRQAHALLKTDKSCLLKLIILLYNLQIFLEEIIFFLSSIFIVLS